MTALEAVRAELVADATVAGLVATRLYPQVAPQAAPLPRIVLTTVTGLPENALTGTADTRLERSVVQVDCYASTYLAAHQVAAAVDGVVANLQRADLSAERSSVQDIWDDEAQVHRVSMDFSVWR